MQNETIILKFASQTADDFIAVNDSLPFSMNIEAAEDGSIVFSGNTLDCIIKNIFFAGKQMGIDALTKNLSEEIRRK